MTCFWVNSNPEESIFGSLITDVLLSLSWNLGGLVFGWLVSGEICRNPQRFRPKFYRQSSAVIQCSSDSCRRYTRRALQHFRFHFCIQRCTEISVEVLHSEFCRVLQKYILECMRSSAEKPPEVKVIMLSPGVLEFWSSGVLESWSLGVLESWSLGALQSWSLGYWGLGSCRFK